MGTTERTSKFRTIVGVAFLALALPAIAVYRPKTPQVPRICVSTRLVKVGVIARDRSGTVENLTKADFVILDRGKRRRISFFSLSSNGLVRGPATPLPANVFSDLPQYGAAAPTPLVP
jgi:hypothetical protein